MRRGRAVRALLGLAMSATVLAAVAPRTLPRLEAIGDPARPAAEVTSFGLRLVATGFAVYVALVLLALLLATLRLVPATTRRAVDRWTTGGLAGGLRRLVGASAIVIGVLPLQPLAAPADPSPPVLAPADLPPGTAPRLEPLPPTTVVPPTTAPPVLHAPEPAPTPPPGDPQPTPTPGPLPALERSLTVAVGDSFWSIARHLVRDHLGRPPSDAEVIEPWLALISANRDRLVDATDPDLLYPGQVLRLPDP